MPASKAALIIIYNHRYDKNIARLESLYGSRFDAILHLVPFYDGPAKNVVAIYENSIYFEGYLAQATRQITDLGADHCIFVGDDLILNPDIDQYNYLQTFSLTENSSFIPELQTLESISPGVLKLRKGKLIDLLKGDEQPANKWLWNWTLHATRYSSNPYSVEATRELPTYDIALPLIERHGVVLRPLRAIDVHGIEARPTSIRGAFRFVSYLWHQYIRKTHYTLPYPFVASYSDITIVDKHSLQRFLRLCGIFAATNLFVELAIPTALCLACADVRTEKSLPRRGKVYWVYSQSQKDAYANDFKPFDSKLATLMDQFPPEFLYIHPIKLSAWK